MNWTNPLMLALFPEVPRLRKPAAAEVAMLEYCSVFPYPSLQWISFPPTPSHLCLNKCPRSSRGVRKAQEVRGY